MTTSAPQPVTADLAISEIEVLVSDRVEDIDDALAVIHDGFVEAGYIAPVPSGRRMHASYLNPGTMFLMARMEGRTVGACALIKDGPFGLPSDRAFVEENDALRMLGRSPVREGGSLAVRSDARRHTRRIMMRLTAAISRMTIGEAPDGNVVIAVAPESLRFYQSALGAIAISGDRPYYGAPAILLRTSGEEIADHCARNETVFQRAMDGLLTEPSPSWLIDHRAHSPLPSDWLTGLLNEQPFAQRLRQQIGLMASHYPDALGGILEETALRDVA